MLTIANKGRYVVKKSQKHVYVICECSLISYYLIFRYPTIAGLGLNPIPSQKLGNYCKPIVDGTTAPPLPLLLMEIWLIHLAKFGPCPGHSLDMANLGYYNVASHSMARANLNKSIKLVTNTTAASGASSPTRQPRQLPWLIFETMINSLANLKKKFSTKQKKTAWIYYLFWRTEKKILFYQANSLLKYTGFSLQNWRNKHFYHSTKQNKSLSILGLLRRI